MTVKIQAYLLDGKKYITWLVTWLRLVASCCTGNNCCGGGYGGVVGGWMVVRPASETNHERLNIIRHETYDLK